MIIPIATTVFAIFSFFTPCVRLKQLDLVDSIFKETTRVITAMLKLLLFLGMVTMVQLVVLLLFIFGAIQIMTTTELKIVKWNYYEFGEPSGFAIFSLVLILLVANWTMQVFAGFQWMTVAGTVASWYFEEDGQRKCSVFKNVSRTLYHVGTITYGSLYQPWVSVLNGGLKFFTCSFGYGVCLFECVQEAQICLETHSKNAFIEAALHGQSFLRSGKRAFNVLLTNAPGAIGMINLGSALVLTNQVNVIIISTAISYTLFLNCDNIWLPTAIACVANTVIVNALFGTFQIAMHTLAICFCEDEIVNDGHLRPYHAPEDLRKFVEKADELYVKRQSSDEEQVR